MCLPGTETGRKRSPDAEEEEDRRAGVGPASTLKKKKKKSHSLVRKLSLNKFRLSAGEQETTRHTPEGGDSSRSQSQSSQESPSLSDSPSRIARKGHGPSGERARDERVEKGDAEKPEKLAEKPVTTVTVVQRKSPSLTIRSFPKNAAHGELSDSSEEAAWPEPC